MCPVSSFRLYSLHSNRRGRTLKTPPPSVQSRVGTESLLQLLRSTSPARWFLSPARLCSSTETIASPSPALLLSAPRDLSIPPPGFFPHSTERLSVAPDRGLVARFSSAPSRSTASPPSPFPLVTKKPLLSAPARLPSARLFFLARQKPPPLLSLRLNRTPIRPNVSAPKALLSSSSRSHRSSLAPTSLARSSPDPRPLAYPALLLFSARPSLALPRTLTRLASLRRRTEALACSSRATRNTCPHRLLSLAAYTLSAKTLSTELPHLLDRSHRIPLPFASSPSEHSPAPSLARPSSCFAQNHRLRDQPFTIQPRTELARRQ